MKDANQSRSPHTPWWPQRWIYRLVIAVTFLSGGIIGGALGAYLMHSHVSSMLTDPKGITSYVMPGIQSRVGLTEQQVRSVEVLIRRRHMAMQTVRAGSQALLISNLENMQREVAAELHPEQGNRWKKLCETIKARYLPPTMVSPTTEVLYRQFDSNDDRALEEHEVFPSMWQFLHFADRDNDGLVMFQEYEQLRASVVQ